MKFTIRLKPQDGESLSSYLFRCCQVNRISFETLWRLICLSKARKIYRKKVHSWDVNPYVLLDFKKTAYLTGQSEEVLESLTYFLVLRKLITGEVNKAALRLQSFDGHNYIHHKSRKICPECIAQGEGHKLIWNIKGIKYCEKHQCLLIDSCPNCKEDFEYSNAYFFTGRCPSCEKVITNEQCENTETLMLNNRSYYLSWEWLLKSEMNYKQNSFTFGQSFGFKLMYAAQNSTEKLYKNQWYNTLKTAVNTRSKHVTLVAVFKVVKLTKKSLWELDKVELTDEIIKDINYFPQRKPIPLGECSAPWCSSFQSNENMTITSNSYWFSKRKDYDKSSVCTSCYMEYGYSKETKEWENTSGAIKIIQEVQTLKKGLFSYKEIAKRLGKSPLKIYEALCYSDYYIGTNFYPRTQITTTDAVKCFKELLGEKGVLWKKAKSLFGWDFIDYYSVFSMREVKRFLYFDSHHCRKKVRGEKSSVQSKMKKEVLEYYSNLDTIITMKEVAETLGISKEHFYQIGLNKIISSNNKRVRKEICKKEGERLTLLAEEFILLRLEKRHYWLKSEMYAYLGIRSEELKRKYLKLYEYIDSQYVKSNQIRSENELNTLKKRQNKL